MSVSAKIKETMEQSSWIRKMFEVGGLLKKEHGAENVFDFSLGNPNLNPPEGFNELLRKQGEQTAPFQHAYMPNAGYPDVREKLAAYISKEYKVEMPGSNCIMTCGAGGALNVILKTILNPGDTIIASRPCFMEYKFYADNHQGSLEIADCKENFDLDIKEIEVKITKKTAAVIINSPNNPSGKIYPENNIKELAKMLFAKSKETGRAIYLISDEPYRKIIFGNSEVPSIFALYKNSIVVTSFSKDLSIPGERIGWLAIHPEAEDIDNLRNGVILCNRILGFVNAPALMQRIVADLLETSVDMDGYKQNRDLLCSSLKQMGYEFNEPEGAFYLFPKAPGGDDLVFTKALQDELILTVPGRGFGMPGYFRIAYCVTKESIEKALPGFERAIKLFK